MQGIRLSFSLVVAVCALAVCASTALASLDNFVTEGPNTIAGKEVTFKAGEGVVKCTEFSYTWEVEGESSTLPVKPKYAGCHVGTLVKVPVTFTNKGCILTAEELTEAGSNKFTDAVGITPKTCSLVFEGRLEGEKPITCVVKVNGEQTKLKGAEFDDTKTAELEYASEGKLEVGAIAYTAEGSGCSAVGIPTGNQTNGQMTFPQQPLPAIIAAPPARWKISGLGGAYLTAGATRAVKLNQQTSLEINATGGGTSKLTCVTIAGTGEVEGTAAGTAGRGRITGLTFTSCSIQAGLAGCTLEEVTSPASATNPFSIALGYNRGGRLDYTIANTPETKITVKLKGVSCPHQGNNLLKGVLEGTYSNSSEAVTFPSTALRFTSLTFLEESCIIIGKFRIELNAGGELVAD